MKLNNFICTLKSDLSQSILVIIKTNRGGRQHNESNYTFFLHRDTSRIQNPEGLNFSRYQVKGKQSKFIPKYILIYTLRPGLKGSRDYFKALTYLSRTLNCQHIMYLDNKSGPTLRHNRWSAMQLMHFIIDFWIYKVSEVSQQWQLALWIAPTCETISKVSHFFNCDHSSIYPSADSSSRNRTVYSGY